MKKIKFDEIGEKTKGIKEATLKLEKINRIVVVPLIRNKDGEYLICKMSKNCGVFPGQWGLPGGGVEKEELINNALKREIKEELGPIKIGEIMPWTFRQETRVKTYPGNIKKQVCMLFLLFDCVALDKNIILNEEFEKCAWVSPAKLHMYNLNEATVITFKQKGLLLQTAAVN